jgi:hypothetical protein
MEGESGQQCAEQLCQKYQISPATYYRQTQQSQG